MWILLISEIVVLVKHQVFRGILISDAYVAVILLFPGSEDMAHFDVPT